VTDRYSLDPRDEIRNCMIGFDEVHGNAPDCYCDGRGYVVGRDGVTTCGGIRDYDEPTFIPAADQRVIEVHEHEGCWFAYVTGEQFPLAGETKDEALLAARCAVWGVDVHELPQFGTWWWTTNNREDVLGPFDTPNCLWNLCAAIDAREK